jgi:DNA-directed RNA polymerase omega subunit
MFKVPENMGNKYRFVTLSALRAEQLQVGAQPRVDASSEKYTVVAQAEVAAGLVEPWEPSAEEPPVADAAPAPESEE